MQYASPQVDRSRRAMMRSDLRDRSEGLSESLRERRAGALKEQVEEIIALGFQTGCPALQPTIELARRGAPPEQIWMAVERFCAESSNSRKYPRGAGPAASGDHPIAMLIKTAVDELGRESLTSPIANVRPIRRPKECRVDFAILTAIQVEREAVCRAFGLREKHRVPRGSRQYWRSRVKHKGGGTYEIVVAMSPDMANVDAAVLAADTIHHWGPEALLMVGIAGAAGPEQALGDIAIGRDVYYYERGKVTPSGRRPEPVIYRADATLWNAVVSIPNWSARVPVLRPDGTTTRPRIPQGVIASGERVIADAEARDEIASAHRKIVAIEMEGYGVGAAVWQSFDRVRFLAIRSICDMADATKNWVWHPYSAAVAAGFTKHFISDQPLR
jgi:nucleoside phosphorylase